MAIKISKIKLVWFDDCYGWIMTGIIGPEAKWFLGFSINNAEEVLSKKAEVEEDDALMSKWWL